VAHDEQAGRAGLQHACDLGSAWAFAAAWPPPAPCDSHGESAAPADALTVAPAATVYRRAVGVWGRLRAIGR
jgi:hypothetical protein